MLGDHLVLLPWEVEMSRYTCHEWVVEEAVIAQLWSSDQVHQHQLERNANSQGPLRPTESEVLGGDSNPHWRFRNTAREPCCWVCPWPAAQAPHESLLQTQDHGPAAELLMRTSFGQDVRAACTHTRLRGSVCPSRPGPTALPLEAKVQAHHGSQEALIKCCLTLPGASSADSATDKLFFLLSHRALSKNLNNFPEDTGHSQLNMKASTTHLFFTDPRCRQAWWSVPSHDGFQL